MSNQPNLNQLWQEAKTALEERLALVKEEIKYYPPPIPACDVYFNSLLEERAKIPHELRHLDEVKQPSAAALKAFVATSVYLDKAMGASIIQAMDKTADFA